MKKSELKGMAKGIVLTLLVMTLAVSAMAAGKMIEVTSGIKLNIDGAAFVPKDVNGNTVEVFSYNGTTYVPIRAISEAFNKEVKWDGTAQTVMIGASATTGYGRTNPAPTGTAQTVTIKNVSEDFTATATVSEIIRGDAAWQKLKADNQFNSAAKDGMEYVIAKVKVSVDRSKDDAAVSFSTYDWAAYSTDNVEYEVPFVVVNNAFDGKVFTGGTLEGYVAFQVKKTDVAPKVVLGQDYNGNGGVWFSLSK